MMQSENVVLKYIYSFVLYCGNSDAREHVIQLKSANGMTYTDGKNEHKIRMSV